VRGSIEVTWTEVRDEGCDALHELFDGWRKSLRFRVRFTSGGNKEDELGPVEPVTSP
jgi:hypothetical protein